MAKTDASNLTENNKTAWKTALGVKQLYQHTINIQWGGWGGGTYGLRFSIITDNSATMSTQDVRDWLNSKGFNRTSAVASQSYTGIYPATGSTGPVYVVGVSATSTNLYAFHSSYGGNGVAQQSGTVYLTDTVIAL